MADLKTILANLSHHPGVYQMLGQDGEVLYVGKAKDLKKRVTSYFSNKSKDLKTATLVKYVNDISVIITNTENEAVLLECNLIKQHRPRYNVLLRDDKSYPYILITTEHTYPRIDIYRGSRKRSGKLFGPYPSAGSVRETISLLQKIFRIRTCRDGFFESRTRPCLLYQIGRCTGPCVKLISQQDYAQSVRLAIKFLEGKSQEVISIMQNEMELASKHLNFEKAADLRDQIDRLRQIQDKQYVSVATGNADIIGLASQAGITCVQLLTIRNGLILGSKSYFPIIPLDSTDAEIISAFLTQHYLSHQSHIESIPKQVIVGEEFSEIGLLENVLEEQAQHRVQIIKPDRGEKKKWLEMANQSAHQSLTTHIYTKLNMLDRYNSLQQELDLQNRPERIECFDISHSMGEATVASCVVFDLGGPVKNHYRRFNIKNISPGDDVAAMHQVLLRRYQRLQKDKARLPDLILIDGGPTQLNAAKKVMDELNIDVMLVGISKGPDRKPGFETLHRINHAPIHLLQTSLALHLIQHIRDEAHRFAITGHRQRRDKARKKSSLEFIPGIGAKRRRELLRYFGGIQGIAHASLDELNKVPGISRSLAERIFAALHDTTI